MKRIRIKKWTCEYVEQVTSTPGTNSIRFRTPDIIPIGTAGTVEFLDDDHVVTVLWDNGIRTLVDRFSGKFEISA